jgi:hypothetical protein
MAIQEKITFHVDYVALKPHTYKGVFAVGDDSSHILRIDTGHMEADYVAISEKLKGTAHHYLDDTSVVNFRIDRDTPEKDRDSNLKRRF